MSRRIMVVSDSPLAETAHSFLNRRSIVVSRIVGIEEALAELSRLAEKSPLAGGEPLTRYPDLLVLDGAAGNATRERLNAVLERARAAGTKVLGIGRVKPPDTVLEMVEAFLVEPYNEAELLGAIGEILGTETRRALRMGVELPAELGAGDAEPRERVTILQISENGCLLEADRQIPLAEQVDVRFVLPSTGEQIMIGGVVVSGNELQLLYGVKFDENRAAERLAILVFVELGLATGGTSTPRG